MNEPILAAPIDAPKPVRTRLFVGVQDKPYGKCSGHSTTLAEPSLDTLSTTTPGYTFFALPGSDEVWTREKIEAEARKYRLEKGVDDPGLEGWMSCFACRLLGVS